MDSKTKAFETFKRAILKPVENTNRFVPGIRIQKTVRPDRVYSFNEIAININKQLR